MQLSRLNSNYPQSFKEDYYENQEVQNNGLTLITHLIVEQIPAKPIIGRKLWHVLVHNMTPRMFSQQ